VRVNSRCWQSPHATAVPKVNERQNDKKRDVFVIEDNELLVKMYRSIFGAMGCRVIDASGQRHALLLLDGCRPDLFIIRERLNDGTWAETVRAIRAHNGFARVPIIATVSTNSQQERDAMYAMGIASVVTKPLQIGPFTALAEQHLLGPAGPALVLVPSKHQEARPAHADQVLSMLSGIVWDSHEAA
jgi:CheY-like chemotaxis protein